MFKRYFFIGLFPTLFLCSSPVFALKMEYAKVRVIYCFGAHANMPSHQHYFEIPIASEYQAPIVVVKTDPHNKLLDYRIIDQLLPNQFLVADFGSITTAPSDTHSGEIEIYALTKEKSYTEMPSSVSFTALSSIPSEVKQFLNPSDCIQSTHPEIESFATKIKNSVGDNIVKFAKVAVDSCYKRGLRQDPAGFKGLDALSIYRRGYASCTGYANLSAAVFRAGGIPAQAIGNLPQWYSGKIAMHYCIRYWLPGYGWVWCETARNEVPWDPRRMVTTMNHNHNDEQDIYLTYGVEWFIHASSSNIKVTTRHHYSNSLYTFSGLSEAQIDEALDITREVWSLYSKYHGKLDDPQVLTLEVQQQQALTYLQSGNLSSYMTAMNSIKAGYEMLPDFQEKVVFSDDMETQNPGWSHTGTNDDWEWGTPTAGPPQAHSGTRLWGTDLAGDISTYENSYLYSPPIDLAEYESARVGFWMWTQVRHSYDGCRVYATRTGNAGKISLTTRFHGGVGVWGDEWLGGNWCYMVFDLTPVVGAGADSVRIIFNISTSSEVYKGWYIDDVTVFGRKSRVEVEEKPIGSICPSLFVSSPFRRSAIIKYSISDLAQVSLKVFDVTGRLVRTLIQGEECSGEHAITWDGKDAGGKNLHSGAYFLHFETENYNEARKLILMR